MLAYFRSLFRRLSALFDKSALVLIVPAVCVLVAIDPPMLKTLVQWMAFAPILAGVAIIVSRIVFPQIQLTDLINDARAGNTGSGIVAASVIGFVAVIVLALVTWAKA